MGEGLMSMSGWRCRLYGTERFPARAAKPRPRRNAGTLLCSGIRSVGPAVGPIRAARPAIRERSVLPVILPVILPATRMSAPLAVLGLALLVGGALSGPVRAQQSVPAPSTAAPPAGTPSPAQATPLPSTTAPGPGPSSGEAPKIPVPEKALPVPAVTPRPARASPWSKRPATRPTSTR